MSDLVASIHFVPLHAIPDLSSDTTVSEALHAFSSGRVGGAMLVTGEVPVGYVRADAVASAVRTQAAVIGWEGLVDKPLTAVLHAAGKALVPVRRPAPGADAAALNAIGDEIVFEIAEEGRRIGWFLNHESLLQSVSTAPPTFLCTNGHRNTNPAGGSCSFCPAPLK